MLSIGLPELLILLPLVAVVLAIPAGLVYLIVRAASKRKKP